jgi:hypothetical protein
VEDPLGLTRRQAARAACDLYHQRKDDEDFSDQFFILPSKAAKPSLN